MSVTHRATRPAVAPPRVGARADSPAGAGIASALLSRARRSTGEDTAGPHARLVSVTLPVDPSVVPEDIPLFAAALQADLEPSLWLQPVDGFAMVGIGRAWSVGADGSARFAAVATAWERLLASARLEDEFPADRAVGPLLIGGLGFTGEEPTDPSWVPFGAASFTVPELILIRSRAGLWVTASYIDRAEMDGGGASNEPDRLQDLWRGLTARTAFADAAGPVVPAAAAPLEIVAEHPDRSTWDRLVDRFAGAVGRGRLDKVVLARRLDVTSPVDLDPVAALRRLTSGSPTSTTYAFARGGNVFLGATPERLISTQGKDFQTVAIAGSIAHDDDATREASLAAELLSSDKDREEHEIVVEMLRTMLEPVAAEIHVAPAPVVRTFGTVQHLVTTVTGRLRDRAGILSMAGLLHPTPAVGGEPRGLALELIAEHEGFERGWYAGPLGWVGADGDGEFVVALRCAVVSGRTAALFAGCGIVADSDPEREWEESRNKMQVVASALGELRS